MSSLWCLDTSIGSGSLFRGAFSLSVGAKRGQHGSVRNEPVTLVFRHLKEEWQCLVVRPISSVGIKHN